MTHELINGVQAAYRFSIAAAESMCVSLLH